MATLMHRTAVLAVQTAFWTALNVVAFKTFSTGGVFNGVPQNTARPYTEIGSPNEGRNDAMASPGKNVRMQVHVVSDFEGDSQGLAIVNKAIELLHYQRLTIANHHLQAIQYETTETYTEIVNGILVRHFVAIFRVTVDQVS